MYKIESGVRLGETENVQGEVDEERIHAFGTAGASSPGDTMAG
jgi:hypothetical protein